jgi:hypothetical protein
MPDPEDKSLSGNLIEVSKGCFVTEAMMEQLREVTGRIERDVYLPGEAIFSKVPKEEQMLAEVLERLDRIERLIKLYLIDGRFREITP